jgi:uncharacterized protein YdeI (BOF family)
MRFFFITATILFLTSPVMAAKDPYTAPNNSRITLNGTVVATSPTAFILDYGAGLVSVEMDGWGWYPSTYAILEGDKVTVYGRVDDDLYEATSIEAGAVYVKDLNTYFYANDTDEEDVIPYTAALHPDKGLLLQGTVVKISGREFTIDTGSKKVKVDTINMPYNPLDDKGYQKIKVGDFVQITGQLDVDFFEKMEVMAETVTTLFKDIAKK